LDWDSRTWERAWEREIASGASSSESSDASALEGDIFVELSGFGGGRTWIESCVDFTSEREVDEGKDADVGIVGVEHSGTGDLSDLGRGCEDGIFSSVFWVIVGRGVVGELADFEVSSSVGETSPNSSAAEMYGSSVRGLLFTIEGSIAGFALGVMNRSSRASTNPSSVL
jgi:hypothetical protein